MRYKFACKILFSIIKNVLPLVAVFNQEKIVFSFTKLSTAIWAKTKSS